MSAYNASVFDLGSGFPGVGDYVFTTAGEYRIVRGIAGYVHEYDSCRYVLAELDIPTGDDALNNTPFPASAVMR